MSYLVDAVLFVGLLVLLVLVGAAFPIRNGNRLEQLVLPGSAFLGLYALLAWLVGSLWRLDGLAWAYGLFLVPALIGVVRRNHLLASWRGAVVAARQFTGWNIALAAYLVLACGLAFVLTLAPPTGSDYDSLTYHLAVPAHYLREGKILEYRYDHHSYFPFLLEMLYLFGLALKGPVLAKLFHWLMLPLGALVLVALGKRILGLRAGLLAATLFVSLPLVAAEATTAYIDLGFVAFTLLAVLCFLNAQEGKGFHWWLWAGVFVGLCLGTKYFGALIFGFLGCWMLGSQINARRIEGKALLAFAGLALMVGGPWYLRNALWTGNPVYPFAFEVFGGAGWTAEMARQYAQDQAHYGFGKGLLDWLLLPWRLSMTPLNAGDPFWPFLRGVPVAEGYWGVFDVRVLDVLLKIFPGPMLLALGGPALFLKPRPRGLVMVLCFFIFLWLFWGISSQQIRYLLPGMALMCVVAGWGATLMCSRYGVARRVIAVCLLLWCTTATALHLHNSRAEHGVIMGSEAPDQFLRRTFPGYLAMEWASRFTPPEARFAVFGEPRCYYLQRDYIWADDQHNNILDFAAMKSDAEFLQGLRAEGVTHVLLNTSPGTTGGAFGPPPHVAGAISDRNMRLLYQANGYQVYSLS